MDSSKSEEIECIVKNAISSLKIINNMYFIENIKILSNKIIHSRIQVYM